MGRIREAYDYWFTPDLLTGHRRISLFISRPWVIIFLTLVVIFAALLFSVNQIMLTVLHSRPEVVVPNLEKRGLTDALRTVSDIGLALQYEGVEFDEGVPAGTIIRQSPPSGMMVRAGRPIRVVISKGGQAIFVPAVIGKSLAEAQSNLGMEGLQVGGVNEIYNDQYDEGVVVGQSPSSGTIVTRGALVDLETSKGPPPQGLPVAPDFAGQTFENVKNWADSNSVKIDLKEDAKAMGAPGTVVQQSPQAGQPILPREKLKITVVPLLSSQQGFRLNYKVPDDFSGSVEVKMVARDNRGESEIYNGEHTAGQTVEIPINVTSTTRVRIYVNGLLKDERVLEP